jgi:hypothetical protein
MATTFIDTSKFPPVNLGQGQGMMAEILNRDICGADNVVGSLRWLDKGDRFNAKNDASTHRLVYLMEGEGVITLESKDYNVAKGAGIYLGPSESASIQQSGKEKLKLFQLVVPKLAGK